MFILLLQNVIFSLPKEDTKIIFMNDMSSITFEKMLQLIIQGIETQENYFKILKVALTFSHFTTEYIYTVKYYAKLPLNLVPKHCISAKDHST